MHLTLAGKKLLLDFADKVKATKAAALADLKQQRLENIAQKFKTKLEQDSRANWGKDDKEIAVVVAAIKTLQNQMSWLFNNPAVPTKELLATLDSYIDDMTSPEAVKDLAKQFKHMVEATKIDFTLAQCDAAINMAIRLTEHWDSTFSLGVLKSSATYLAEYEQLNGGTGSWAVVIANEHGLELAHLSEQLFGTLQANLFIFLDVSNNLDPETGQITVGPKTFGYAAPRAILASALKQMRAAIEFWSYINRNVEGKKGEEGELAKGHKLFNDRLQELGEQPSVADVVEVLKPLLAQSSSYIQKALLSDDDNKPALIPTQRSKDFFARKLALGILELILPKIAEKLSVENFRLLKQTIEKMMMHQQANERINVMLKTFNDKIDVYLTGDHEEGKKNILKRLKASLEESLRVLATQQRVDMYFNEDFFKLAQSVELSVLAQYDDHFRNDATKQAQVHQQLLQHMGCFLISSSDDLPDNLKDGWIATFKQPNISISAIRTLFNNIRDYLRNGWLQSPAVWLLNSLVVTQGAIYEHHQFVQEKRTALGETGDLLQDFFSELLNSFRSATLQDDYMIIVDIRISIAKLAAANELDDLKAQQSVASAPIAIPSPSVSVRETEGVRFLSSRSPSPRNHGNFAKHPSSDEDSARDKDRAVDEGCSDGVWRPSSLVFGTTPTSSPK